MATSSLLNMAEEFSGIDFNSSRLEKRFIRTMETLSSNPGKSIWLSSESRNESHAIYRMLGNERLSISEVLRSHRESTVRRMSQSGETILAIQDTTSLNYGTHKKMEGIGYMSDTTLGVNVHTCLAVTTSGLVLGLLSQSHYSRPHPHDRSMNADRKKLRPLSEKESFRWVRTLWESIEALPANLHTVTVCDREGDMYELFDAAEKEGQPYLIRIAQNRTTTESRKALDQVGRKRISGKATVLIPRDTRRGLKERNAVLQIRYDTLNIMRPAIRSKDLNLSSSQNACVIHVKEENPPDGCEPIEWFLMTNEPVADFESAYEKVVWYMHRWKIERFHYVLKSGCAVEKLQERSVEKTAILVLMYSIIACSIMNITYAARICPDMPCSLMFDKAEWQLLYCVANKSKSPPKEPYAIAQAVTYLSWLGGPKRAPSDGPPGVKVIWMGIDKLYTIVNYEEEKKSYTNSVAQV